VQYAHYHRQKGGHTKQNEQSNALDLLSAYLADGKLNSRQAMIIQHAIKHLGAVYTIEGHKISQNIGYATAKLDLEGLAKLGLLQRSKRGRAFIFIAPNDLEQRIKEYQ
jgi:Fic family protein